MVLNRKPINYSKQIAIQFQKHLAFFRSTLDMLQKTEPIFGMEDIDSEEKNVLFVGHLRGKMPEAYLENRPYNIVYAISPYNHFILRINP